MLATLALARPTGDRVGGRRAREGSALQRRDSRSRGRRAARDDGPEGRRLLAAGLARLERSSALGAATRARRTRGSRERTDRALRQRARALSPGGASRENKEEGIDPDWGYISRLGGPRVRRGLGCRNGWPWVAGMGGWEAQEASGLALILSSLLISPLFPEKQINLETRKSRER